MEDFEFQAFFFICIEYLHLGHSVLAYPWAQLFFTCAIPSAAISHWR
jgi:hypothetical protein